ncbi:uncharacterized protein PHACADRAFT_265959 [Phanerochaete carnosa HHB-10118-sp]|uniref:Uncharacterized protein n=1 Tax=Phanerochaete carnosa (strain HHB-10118-sp) TaxID=650164 RepID=K5WFJ9_PHACS|nr:uncharacterized protein PHACADRAFT_246725 [Phanerochaete carnosa HHB-10118-sp]XP_007402493.1 uncharacterized protein PHACADRAFT_265959 [Phanerochaete carnosa HHB-10118-sp]EKM48957.1 hypothetical protein PHACADRAFT_265959 [Phanerochaete carnosa HHB-10118-sp]EKM60664.1 hypothetical protein PHACADRAFT_246725 [Phanerochaete carnosa HHB-10118-sp]
MRLTTVLGVVVAVFVAHAAAQSCPSCPTPGGCPGQCVQDGGEPFCAGFCNSTGMSPCEACTDQNDGVNCFYDSGLCVLKLP